MTFFHLPAVPLHLLKKRFAAVSLLFVCLIGGCFDGLAQADGHKVADGRPCPQQKSVTDIDGNHYATVQIGDQCWMRENLRVTRYADGDTILLSTGKRDYYAGYRYEVRNEKGQTECFYNWQAASRGLHSKEEPSNVQGVCPDGWHLPSKEEWEILIQHVNTADKYTLHQNKLFIGKSLAAQSGWLSVPDTFAIGSSSEQNNLTGFSAVPAGGYFDGPAEQGIVAGFWSSTLTNYGTAYYFYLHSYQPYASMNAYDQRDGRSVRCVLTPSSSHSAEKSKTDEVSPAADGQPCQGDSVVKDFDKNIYHTVQIGAQCWMKENLRTTHFANGGEIKLGKEKNNTRSYRYAPNDTMDYVEKYGYLYNWHAAMNGAKSSNKVPSDVQGVCPHGWHLPSLNEWQELTNYLYQHSCYHPDNDKNNTDKALSDTKEWGTDSYIYETGKSIDNATGFNVLPAGLYEGFYDGFGHDAYFWSSTSQSKNLSYFFAVGNSVQANYHFYYYNGNGYSVRCLRD